MQELGRMLMILGGVLVVVGALLWFGKSIRLPGDIYVQKGNFSFGFPIVTCILISVIVTVLLNIFRR